MLARDYKDTNFITSLRAIAILLVFIIHSGGGGLREFGAIGNFFVDIGKYGVQMFFVISGFTIFSQFFSDAYTLKKFILVRISRISIPYYPILIILYIYIYSGAPQFNEYANQFNNGSIDITNLVAHILYLSSYNINFQNTIIGVEWTLGIEVFFYVFFGLVIHFKLFKLNKSSFIIFGILFLLINTVMLIMDKTFHFDYLLLHWMPFKYGYMFFLGGSAYYFRNKLNNLFIFERMNISRGLMSDSILFIIIASLILSAITLMSFRYLFSLIELGFVFGTCLIIIFFNNNGRLSKILDNKFLVFFGSISYSFYLIHYIIISILPKVNVGVFDFFIELCVSIIISFIWYFIFEKVIYSDIKRFIKKM